MLPTNPAPIWRPPIPANISLSTACVSDCGTPGSSTPPAVILLHGFCASLDTWEPWARVLSTDYRVIRFDLPGFGLTGPDPSGDYSGTTVKCRSWPT